MAARPIARKDVKLKPLPLRLSTTQFERLVSLRARDGMAIQEHVRRAVDVYLDQQDKRQARATPPADAVIHGAGPIERAYQAPQPGEPTEPADIPLPTAVTARPDTPATVGAKAKQAAAVAKRAASYGLR